MDTHARPVSACPLGCLSADVIVAMLTSVDSTADLYALISASPEIYRVFLISRRLVLLRLLSRDLGPALRDAIAAAVLIPDTTISVGAASSAIEQYAALPHDRQGVRSLVRKMSDDELFAIVKMNRSVQFLVDQLAARRLSELELIHPLAAGPPTATERWRFAQGLLRHQFLARIDQCDPWSRHAQLASAPLVPKFLGIFRPWQVHQLADVHCFLCDVLDRMPVGPAGTWLTQGQKQIILRDVRVLRATVLGRPPPPAPELEFPPRSSRRPGSSFMLMKPRYDFLTAGPLPYQVQNADPVAWQDRPLRDELYEQEDTMPRLLLQEAGYDDIGAAPAAWVDGHDGLDCQRWGRYTHREPPRPDDGDTDAYQRAWMGWQLDRWRWLGFAFWDQYRFEALKTRLRVYATGWLTTAQLSNEECKVEVVRLQQHTRP